MKSSETSSLKELFSTIELKPTVILMLSALLVTVHRYFGSIEFAPNLFPSISNFNAVLFMFTSGFILLGLLPVALISLFFQENLKNFGLKIGDWKFGLIAILIFFPIITGLVLYPASQMQEIRAFYPFDKEAGASISGFLRLEISRGMLYYSAWEFFFRGFMLFGLRRYVGNWLSICIQTIPSALWHIGMPTGEILASLPAGILFGILALRSGSILWPWLLHFLIGIGIDLLIILT